MNKSELTRLVAKRTGMTFVHAQQIMDVLIDCMTESLIRKDKVVLSGFGCLRVCRQDERPVRNPRTGQKYTLVPRDSVKFTVGAGLFDKLNADKEGLEKKSIAKASQE